MKSAWVISHPGRAAFHAMAVEAVQHMRSSGVAVQHHSIEELPDPEQSAAPELVLVMGGDGSILRGAEVARATGAALLGINGGRLGFLAQAERDSLPDVLARLVAEEFNIETRATIEVQAFHDDRCIASGWALNEVTVEKAARERMLDLSVDIDGAPLSSWGCDGVIVATPTGSTAYAFSCGGPVLWPHIAGLVLAPISAHALFARPLVLPPTSTVSVYVSPRDEGEAVMWCDGARAVPVPLGSRIEITGGGTGVRCVTFDEVSFTQRLVDKFDLNINGWRGQRHA